MFCGGSNAWMCGTGPTFPRQAIIGYGPEAFGAHHPYRSARGRILRLSHPAGVKGLERRATRRQGNREGEAAVITFCGN